MSPEAIVRASRSAISATFVNPDEALDDPAPPRADPGRSRRPSCCATGYPAYTTSSGWLGYDDDKIRRLCREGVAAGWTQFKLKVGRDRADDIRRLAIVREEIGPDARPDGRCQPGLGRRPGDRLDGRPRLRATALHRGADQPGRHPRSRPDRSGPSSPSGSGWRPVSTPTTGSWSSSSCRPRRSPSGSSTPAASAGSTRPSPCSCWRPRRASRSVRTPVASGCANTSSTLPCSTTSRLAARSRAGWSNMSTTCTSTFVDPVVVEDGSLPRARRPPGYSIEMRPVVAGRLRLPRRSGLDDAPSRRLMPTALVLPLRRSASFSRSAALPRPRH